MPMVMLFATAIVVAMVMLFATAIVVAMVMARAFLLGMAMMMMIVLPVSRSTMPIRWPRHGATAVW
eukprot:98691-Lingulodinium_polyedra.AAC.1